MDATLPPDETEPSQVGERVGSYRVTRRISHGGMAVLYEGQDENGIKVAIKVLRACHLQNADIAARFSDEARVANLVRRGVKGLVDFYAVLTLPNLSQCIVMEYLEGESLRQRMSRSGRMEQHAAMRIGKQVASGLAAAHAKQVVHRDLKPVNVMLISDPDTPDGERVKILDFGIAKGVTENLGPASEEYRTNTGMVLGTATYMAPEQCKGAGNVTAKADVYSLGVIMYRMCCGQLPFRAEGQGEVMAMHIFSVAKPLRDRDASIPEQMNDLVARMMSKEPADRPSMVQVVQDLDKMASTGTASNQPVVMMLSDPPPESSGVSSTLSAALGQSGRMKALASAVPRKPRLWLGLLGTAALVLVGLGLRFSIAKMQLGTPLRPSVIVWALNSNPPDAEVVRKKDGKLLCRTPCQHEPELGVGRLQVLFRAPGFVDEEIALDEQKPFSSMVRLRPQPEKSPPAAVTPPPPPPAAPEVKAPTVSSSGTPASGTTEPAAPPSRSPDSRVPSTGIPGSPPRGTTEPGAVRQGKQPGLNWPRRPVTGKTSEQLLTDDKIQIIQ